MAEKAALREKLAALEAQEERKMHDVKQRLSHLIGEKDRMQAQLSTIQQEHLTREQALRDQFKSRINEMQALIDTEVSCSKRNAQLNRTLQSEARSSAERELEEMRVSSQHEVRQLEDSCRTSEYRLLEQVML